MFARFFVDRPIFATVIALLMVIAGGLSILVALVFPMEQYENFLFFIGAMFIPLFGVVLTDLKLPGLSGMQPACSIRLTNCFAQPLVLAYFCHS